MLDTSCEQSGDHEQDQRDLLESRNTAPIAIGLRG